MEMNVFVITQCIAHTEHISEAITGADNPEDDLRLRMAHHIALEHQNSNQKCGNETMWETIQTVSLVLFMSIIGVAAYD